MNTVVIVDDEPITRMDLSDMLRELGFTVAGEAADGFDAIELCRSLRPDVVLMDVRMPVFDGLTATETILEEDLAGCVILLTAFSDREIIDRASRAGVTGYLVKPIDQKSLPAHHPGGPWPRASACAKAARRPRPPSGGSGRNGRSTRPSSCWPRPRAAPRPRPTGACAKPPWTSASP